MSYNPVWNSLSLQLLVPSVTLPVDGDYSWLNQGSATKTVESNGSLSLAIPLNDGGTIHARTKSLRAAPYKVTMGFIPNLPYGDFAECGLILKNSGGNSLVTFGFRSGSSDLVNGPCFVSYKYTDTSTFSAAYTMTATPTPAVMWMAGPILWMQIWDDNTSRILRVSNDGRNFHQIGIFTRTDFITPDQWGFFVRSSSSLFGNIMNVISLSEVAA